MNFKNCIVFAACSLACCLPLSSVRADLMDRDILSQIGVELDLTNGYRQDRINTRIHSFDPPGTLISVDDLKARELSYYQLGVKTRWTLCEWLIRLDGDYGWGDNGRYREVSASTSGLASITRARLHNNTVWDFSVGGGYLFPLFECITIGPIAGWSYSHQRLKTRRASTDGVPDPVLSGLKYTTRWEGPWLGVEAQHSVCDFLVRAGYEYHWADWRATWRLSGPDVFGVAFSDTRRSKDSYGNVAYVDGRWYICPSWNIGIGFKYQDFRVTRGRERPSARSFAAVGLSSIEVDRVRSATWRSYAVTFDIGYDF